VVSKLKNAPIYIARSLVSCIRLWLLVLAFMLSTGGLAGAAEGYRAFAERIVAQPPQGAQVAEDIERAILQSLNSYRASKGRKPLKRASADLVLAARAQAFDLMQTNSMGHGASTGHSFESRMRAMLGKAMFLPAMAENAARDRRKDVGNAGKAQGLMTQWIKSPGHRKNLTNLSYVAVAIGAVKRGDEVYAVQIFVGPETKTNMFQ
jgi:uncharacterized protein YkwD